MIEVLSDKLDGWLSTISLFFRHVEVIDEDYAFFTNWWTVVTFSTLLHF
jgi:hypothetical protein